jgi:hypothetical protein
MAMIKKPFDYDPFTGIRETFHYDEETGDVYIEAEQDVETIANEMKALYADTDERARWGEGGHVARIPNVILEAHPELMHDNEALKKWLNDPDNRVFRSRPGKI